MFSPQAIEKFKKAASWKQGIAFGNHFFSDVEKLSVFWVVALWWF
jgi:hypothetical protein